MSGVILAAYSALKVAAIAVTVANDFLLTSFWIISASPTSTTTDTIPLPPPVFTTVIYAIAEPLFVWLLQKTQIAPWIFLVNIPHHFWICEVAAAYLCLLVAHRVRSPESSQAPSEQWEASILLPKELEQSRNRQGGLVASIPVLSAAASNAAMLMFAHSLDDLVEEQNAALLLLFGLWGLIFYLGSRYGDLRLASLAERWPLWEDDTRTRLIGIGICTCMLFVVRSSLRILLGMNAFPIISGLGSIEIGQEVPCFVSWTNACTPAWVRLIIIIAPLPLSYAGAMLLRCAISDERTVSVSSSEPKYD